MPRIPIATLLSFRRWALTIRKASTPVKILVTSDYVRAVRGGVGEAKTPGNYASSLLAGEQAHDAGYTQVLWLDGVEQKYLEEVGSHEHLFRNR